MRRACLILLVTALLAPAAAWASPQAPGAGSLAVSAANGTLVVTGRGVIFGYFVQGSLLVIDYRPDVSGEAVSVSGATQRGGPGVAAYSGSDVRFLLPAGRYTIELIASGIDVSAVGRGSARAIADASTPAGSLSVDGGRPLPFARPATSASFGLARSPN